MNFGEFLQSPGFGGIGAILAAILVAVSALMVSQQRRAEADRVAADLARENSLERWWTQYSWLVSTEADRLPFEGRVEILVRLLRTAERLDAAELIGAARVYFVVLRRWIDERAHPTAITDVRDQFSSSVEQEIAGFSAARRATAIALLDAADRPP